MRGGEFVHIKNFTIGRLAAVEFLTIIGGDPDLVSLAGVDFIEIDRMCSGTGSSDYWRTGDGFNGPGYTATTVDRLRRAYRK